MSNVATSRAPSPSFPQMTHFGPGLMETWCLTSWVKPDHSRMVRLTGWYPVYCGAGEMHAHRMDIRAALDNAVHHAASWEPEAVALQLAEWAMEDYPGCECEQGPT